MTRHGLLIAFLVAASCDGAPDPLEPGAAVDDGAGGTEADDALVVADACDTTTTLAAGVTHPRGLVRRFELEHDGVTRTFKVHVPAGYRGQSSVPLVFVNHALTQTGVQFGIFGSDMEAEADRGGFIAVFADGRFRSWNGGGCCDRAAEEDVDDVGFFRAMLTTIHDDLGLCIDRTRVYSTGLSAGAFLSYRLACDASDVFAAVASVAGALAVPAADCGASQVRPVPLLHIHGTGDTIVEYDTAVDSVADWAALAGCDGDTVAAAQPVSRLDTTCVTQTGCPAGVEVTLCSVDDGGHCWFGNWTCGTGVPGGGIFVGRNARGIVAASAVWGFLSRFTCPSCGQ